MKFAAPGPAAVVATLCMATVSVAALVLGGPPAPLPRDAAATEFSAERAIAHISRIAQRPHPVGSADHARVRDYLARELTALGLSVERQDAVAIRRGPSNRAGRVENMMVRLAGTASTGAILLATHYDSVPAGPGAADAGSGVGALVETLRALRAGPPLRNDLVALFTDGEEFGLLGAEAFVSEHPWAKEVRLALNVEARGTTGPAQMFETGAGNGLIVREWAAAVPHPTGSSLTYEVYKRMPNDTDFSVFKRLDLTGLNFAFVGNWEAYHTPLDSVSNLDRGSLQHHGLAALALVRRFGALDLTTIRDGDAIYFGVPIIGVAVRYSSFWAWPLAVGALLLWLWITIRARRAHHTSIGGLILAFLIFVILAGAAGFWGFRFSRVVGRMHAGWLPAGNVLTSGPYAGALVASVATVWLALYVLLRKKFKPHTLALGVAGVSAVLTAVATQVVAGGSYVLLWPLAGSVLAAAVLPEASASRAAYAARTLLVCALGLPAMLILWPLAADLFATLGVSPEGGATMAAVAIFAPGALAPQIELISEGRRFWPAALALVAMLACLVWGAATTRYSAEHPRAVNVLYVLDADAHQAYWTARVDGLDPWLRSYLGDMPAKGRPAAIVPPWSSAAATAGFVMAPAGVTTPPLPEAVIVNSGVADGGRTMTIRVAPGLKGHALSVWLAGQTVLGAKVNGRAAGPGARGNQVSENWWSLDYMNAPASGITVSLDMKGTGLVRVAVVERFSGLPEIPGKIRATRSVSTMPIQLGDQTIIRRTFSF